MKKWVLFVALAGLAVGIWCGYQLKELVQMKGCQQLSENIVPLPAISAEVLRFIAVGDTGTGNDDQKKVAEGIRTVCEAQGCDFMLMLGDNFYPKGVRSLQDPAFEEQFEAIYHQVDKPFMVIAGNHDIKGDLQFQVFYSLKSQKWRMPNYAYEFQIGPARFFGINSNCHLTAFERLRQQLQDLPDSPWTFVFAHHPVYSNGNHGDGDFLLRSFWKVFLQNRVDFYLSGHDHQLAHLQQVNHHAEYIVSGAGGQYDFNKSGPSVSTAHVKFTRRDLGFAWFEVTPHLLTLRFYNENGSPLYQYAKKKS